MCRDRRRTVAKAREYPDGTAPPHPRKRFSAAARLLRCCYAQPPTVGRRRPRALPHVFPRNHGPAPLPSRHKFCTAPRKLQRGNEIAVGTLGDDSSTGTRALAWCNATTPVMRRNDSTGVTHELQGSNATAPFAKRNRARAYRLTCSAHRRGLPVCAWGLTVQGAHNIFTCLGLDAPFAGTALVPAAGR